MVSLSKDGKAKSKAPAGSSAGVDVGLEVMATVLATLQTLATGSPIPGLKQAADLALQITRTAQTAKGNKKGFESLAADARQLVYVIFRTNQDVEEDNVPAGLIENLDQFLSLLFEVKTFAEKGASRKWFSRFFRAGVDAGQIQDYREKMKQWLGQFGFQTDINLQLMVHQLVEQQGKLLELLESKKKAESTRDTREPGSSGTRFNQDPGSTSVSGPSDGSNRKKDPFKSQKVIVGGTNEGREKGRVAHDNSVHLGQGVGFSGAYGFTFGGSPTVTWNMDEQS